MTDQEKTDLKIEIQHIFDSGANEIRIFNMVEALINKRNKAIDFTHCSIQLKGDKYTQAFNNYVDKFFKYRPKVYQWVSKDGKREFTHKQLCKYYTKAMNESPFIV